MLDAFDARRVRADDEVEVGGFVKPSFFSVWMWRDRSRTPGVTREAIEGNDSKISPRRVVEESLKNDTRRVWLRELVGFPTQRSGPGARVQSAVPGQTRGSRGDASSQIRVCGGADSLFLQVEWTRIGHDTRRHLLPPAAYRLGYQRR